MLPFQGGVIVAKKHSWSHQLDTREDNEAKPLLFCVSALLKTVGQEVNGVHLIATFVKRRMHSIQARVHLLYEYEGAADATHLFAEELSVGEVEARVCSLTTLKVGEPHAFDPPVTPFSLQHLVPVVTSLFISLCLFTTFFSVFSTKFLLL